MHPTYTRRLTTCRIERHALLAIESERPVVQVGMSGCAVTSKERLCQRVHHDQTDDDEDYDEQNLPEGHVVAQTARVAQKQSSRKSASGFREGGPATDGRSVPACPPCRPGSGSPSTRRTPRIRHWPQRAGLGP